MHSNDARQSASRERSLMPRRYTLKYDPALALPYWKEGKPYHEICKILGWEQKNATATWKFLLTLAASPDAPAEAPADPSGPEVVTHKENESVYELPRTRLCTLEQLLEAYAIDLDVFEVKEFRCTKSEMGYKDSGTQEPGHYPLYHIRAVFTRSRLRSAVREQLEAMRAEAKEYAPVYAPIPYHQRIAPLGGEHLLVMNLPDIHFGKLCWGKETGGADYDLETARRVYLEAVDDLLARVAGYNVGRVLYVPGNDMMNADNPLGTTTKGTPQTMDSRYPKIFEEARRSVCSVIERLTQIAPVDAVFVSGNHDVQSMWCLGDSVSGWMSRNPNVRVDNRPLSRKYYQWEQVLIGLQHGDKQKAQDMPLQMASDCPQEWAASSCREWFTGHWHKLRTTPSEDDIKGVTVRTLPSLCPPDLWHSEAGYTSSVRRAIAYLYDAGAWVGQHAHSIGQGAEAGNPVLRADG